jgi:hypothetical protein
MGWSERTIFKRIRQFMARGVVSAMAQVLIRSRPVKQAFQPRPLLGLGNWGGSSGENACFCYQMGYAAEIGSRTGLAQDRRCANFGMPVNHVHVPHAAPRSYLIHMAPDALPLSLFCAGRVSAGALTFSPTAGLS